MDCPYRDRVPKSVKVCEIAKAESLEVTASETVAAKKVMRPKNSRATAIPLQVATALKLKVNFPRDQE